MTYSGVEVAYMDGRRMSESQPTERAMTEGELRRLVARAIGEEYGNPSRKPGIGGLYLRIADAVLAVLRPHLGLGVTEEEKGLVVDAVDAWAERYGGSRLNRLRDSIRVKMGYPAIAGRGE